MARSCATGRRRAPLTWVASEGMKRIAANATRTLNAASTRNGARHEDCAAIHRDNGTPAIVRDCGGEGPLADGLYGASEMVMDGFMHLREAGILRRRAWDFLPLEQALADRAAANQAAAAQTASWWGRNDEKPKRSCNSA